MVGRLCRFGQLRRLRQQPCRFFGEPAVSFSLRSVELFSGRFAWLIRESLCRVELVNFGVVANK